MKRFIIILIVICSSQILFAQKKAIDGNTYKKWTVFDERPLISNDGKYITYSTSTGYGKDRKTELFLQATGSNWKLKLGEINFVSMVRFSNDSKHCIVKALGDSLVIVNLVSKSIEVITNVLEFRTPELGPGVCLVYSLKNEERTTFYKNLKTGKVRKIGCNSYFSLSKDGNWIVLQGFSRLEVNKIVSLSWINLVNGRITKIWEGENFGNLILDFRNKQMAFKISDQVLFYRLGMKTPIELFGKNASAIANGLRLGALHQFSETGDRLFVSLNAVNVQSTKVCNPRSQIWSYRDLKLKSTQENTSHETQESYLAIIRVKDKKLIQIQKNPAEVFINGKYEDTVLCYIKTIHDNVDKSLSKLSTQFNYNLIDTKTGNRRSVDDLFKDYNPQISPCRKYVIYFDSQIQAYLSYEIRTGHLIDLTANLKASWLLLNNDYPNSESVNRGVAGWLPNDEAVLVYSDYDIWKLDPTGVKKAVNITNGLGEINNIIFSLATEDDLSNAVSRKPVFLNAFNTKTKDNGFYKKLINGSGDPEMLTMGKCIYKTNSFRTLFGSFDFTPIKAKENDLYLIQRMSSTVAPNFYITNDFKNFRQLTDIQPQKAYNWYTTELHSWKSLNGRTLQGVLYKPQDFNASKKYPVIFYCYDKLSDGLNAFLTPELSGGIIDIPTYVSNGYLVFCPDIYYEIGDPMQGTYNSIFSATQYITKLPFVNHLKLGLQGHSWGAIQTNYIVTHTNLFAAACSSSGISDWISGYGSLGSNGNNVENSRMYELGQLRMGATPWSNRGGYIKSSPIFNIDKVSTPILIKHGKLDQTCAYDNALEFFLGLRRLGKRAWMLTYSNEGHELINELDAKDFSVRMMQFFDYYLKDCSAPTWMLKYTDENLRTITKPDPEGLKTLLDPEESKGDGLLKMQKKVTAKN